MSPRFPSLAPLVALSALLVGLSTGCGEGPGPNPNPSPVPADAARSTVEVSRTQDVVADGEDSAAVTVTVRAADGAVLAGRQVRLEVSGEGATVAPAQGLTDGGGVLRAALKASAPGVKTVTASVQDTGGVVVLSSRPGVGFVRRPPVATQLAFTSTSLSATAGSPVGPVLEVAIQDASGVTVPGANNDVTLALGTHPAGAVLSGALTVRAVNGVARFTEAVLTQAGTGYTLLASAQGLTGATSAAFNVVPGPAARLAFTQQPGGQSVRRALSPVRVGLEDAFGNTVRAGTPVVTVALQGGAATLGGTAAVAAVAGVASFTDLAVDAEGSGYRLAASAQGLEGATSDAFSIVDDVAPAVAVLRAGVATARTVDVEWNAVGDDGLLGTATAYQLRYATSPIVSEADFAAATPVSTGAPQAPGTVERVTLGGLTPDTSYSVALRVTDSAGNAVRSSSLAVSTQPLPATQLAFTQQPVETSADAVLADIRVALRDANGNTVTSSTQAVTLTLVQDPSLTRTVNAVGGVATFSGLRLTTARAGYTFRATSGALPAVVSAPFAIRPAGATRLDLVGLAAPVVAGVQGTVEVTAYDTYGNVVTAYAGVIALTSSDAAAVLPSRTVFTEEDQGRKTLRVTLRTAGRQSVTVTDGFISDSLEADVAAAAPARLAFTQQPQNGRTRTALSEVRVSLLDAFGNVARVDSPAVTLTLAGNDAATLGGTRTRAPINGVASFAGLTVDEEGPGYTLSASADGLTGATSTRFTVVDDVPPGRPVLSVGRVEPRSVVITWSAVGDDGELGTAAEYELRYATTPITSDADFERATRVSTGAPRAPGTRETAELPGLTPDTRYYVALLVRDNAGNATRAGTLEVTTSAPQVAGLAFTQQPVGGIAGEALASIRVALVDAEGQTVTSATSPVTLTLVQDASLTRTVDAVSGVATFSGLRINAAGTGYTFQASSSPLPSVVSTAFTIRPGAARRLELASLTDPVTAGTASNFEVTAYDAHDNVATGYEGTVRFTSTDGAAQLPADVTFAPADQGVVTVPVTLRTAGFQSLTATDRADSTVSGTASVNVGAGPAFQLAFVGQPVDGRVRSALAEVRVAVRDEFGNLARSSSAEVTLALRGGAATLGGTVVRSASSGEARFPGLTVDLDGTGYTLTASANGLRAATSEAFSILDDVAPSRPLLAAGAITRNALTVEWDAVGDDGLEGTAAAYELRYATSPIVTDADFDAATRAPTGAPRAPGSREAVTLSGLTPSTTYHVALRVTDNAGNAVRSATLTVSTQDTEATRLAFTRQPVDGTAGAALADIQVTLQDEDGHTASTSSAAVTLTLSSDPTVTVTVSAVSGVATFSGLRIDAAGTGYTFQAMSGPLPVVTSAAFAIRPAAAVRLALSGPVSPVTAGQAPAFTVTAFDAFDNVATGYTGTVRFTSTDAQATVPADATFTVGDAGRLSRPVTLRTQGEQRVSVVDVGQDTLTAEAFATVEPGAAAGFAMTAPETTTAGAGARVSITALDAFGNVATGYTGTIHFSSTDGAASLPADFTFLPGNQGREQFDVILRTAGSREVRVEDVSDPALAAVRTVQVTPHFVESLSLRAQAGPHEAGATFSVEVVALDAFGNVATGYDSSVSFTSSDLRASLPGAYTFTPADAGRRVFQGVSLGTAGVQSLIVTDFAGRESTLELAVEPADAARLELVADSTTSVAGAPVGLVLTVRDAFDNVATGYQGTVRFTATDSGATLPADYTFTAADLGVRRFQATLVTAGNRVLTVTDTVDAALTGTAGQTVEPGAPARLDFLASPFNGQVRMPLPAVLVGLRDAYGNLTRAQEPAVQLTLFGTTPDATLEGTTVVSPQEGIATFLDLSVTQEGSFTLTATATGLDSAMSTPFFLNDFIPPELPVLSATDVQATRLTLSWTAVGDDGMLGDMVMYDLRYSTQPITTEADWNNATRGPDLSALPPGSSMSATITGLVHTTRYYFGLQVMDLAGNNVRALFDTSTTEPTEPCDGVVCEPPAATCTPDGRSLVTYTSACREVDGAGVCESTPAATTRCQEGTVCGNGACEPITADQQAGNIVITEFSVLGAERVELYNATNSDIDLRGYTLEDRSGTVMSIRAVTDLDGSAGTPVMLPARGYLHGVVNPADGVVPAGPGFIYGAPGAGNMLDDDGDLLLLSDADGTVEDLVDFRRFFVTDPDARHFFASFMAYPGSTTQLDGANLNALANNVPLNWCVTFYPATGARQKVPDTLGAANGSCRVAVINEVFIDSNGSGSDDGTAFIEIAGPGGAPVGDMQITDVQGDGASAGNRNTDGSADTDETDGIFVIPPGTRIPADGLLIIADVTTSNRTTSVPNFVVGSDVAAFDMDLENGGRDSIQLIASDGTLLDAVGTDPVGNPLSTNRAFNGLAMYETRTALYPPANSTLARSTRSLDTDDNRADFHGDPTPTPGRPNDTVNVTITSMSPGNGLASTTTSGFVVTGTDIPFDSTLRFGTNTSEVSCTNSLDGTRMTCTVPSNGNVPAVVDVTVVLNRSVWATDIVMPAAFTYTGVSNEDGGGNEADYCVLQHPRALTVTSGQQTELIYGRIYEAGVTEAPGGNPGIRAEVGFGPASSNPTGDTRWRYVPAVFNVQVGNDDEYMATLTAPAVSTPTQYRYTVRFSRDNGLHWTYCDLNGAGANGGLIFEAGELGVMTVNP